MITTPRHTPWIARVVTTAVAIALSAIAVAVIGGCASTTPAHHSTSATSTPPAAPVPVILAGDAAVVRLGQAITAHFGDLAMSGLRRGDGDPDHARGRALDVLIPGWDTPSGQRLGDTITAWVQAHAADYGVRYTLWRRGYRTPGGPVVPVADRGSATGNNDDHLHVSVTGTATVVTR